MPISSAKRALSAVLVTSMFVTLPFIMPLTMPARADVNSEMSRFWNNLGGTATVTGPTAFKGQAAGYYSLGNIRTRSNTRVSQIASFQLPSVEAGCGGIDVFSGAFSMISKEELIQLSKAIAANGVGFAFDLALETLSPVVAETMQKLRDLMQKLNAANINSCETAQALVSGDWSKAAGAFDAFCAEFGVVSGKYKDYAEAKTACGTNAGASSVAARSNNAQSADEKSLKDKQPTNTNITWEVLRGDRFISSDWLRIDSDMSEMMMSLAGTIVITIDSHGNREVKPMPALGYDRAMIDWYIEGGTSPKPLYRCVDRAKCLNVVTDNTKSIPPSTSLKGRVTTAIDGLIDAISAGNKPAPADGIALVNRTSLPLYRILNVYAAYSGPIIDTERDVLIDAIAADLALQFLNDIIDEITMRARSSQMLGQEAFKLWEEDLHRLRREVRSRQIEAQGSYNKALELVERVRLIESQLAGRFGDQFGKSIGWSGTSGGGS